MNCERQKSRHQNNASEKKRIMFHYTGCLIVLIGILDNGLL